MFFGGGWFVSTFWIIYYQDGLKINRPDPEIIRTYHEREERS